VRKLIFAINLTLDGCCDHTKSSSDDEIHEHYAQLMRELDVLVFGRKTYESMVPFWPDVAQNHSGETKAINDFAQEFASKKIVVFSRTLGEAEGTNTKILRGNLEDEILKLKKEPGKDILAGGVSLPTQLIELGLVDEYRFVIQPIIVGEGRRLMDDVSLPAKLELKLVESETFQSGAIALRYISDHAQREASMRS